MKIKYTLAFAFCTCVLPGPGIAGPELDSARLSNVRGFLRQARHLQRAELLVAVKKMAPEQPELYLMEVARDDSLRAYLRMRAFDLLADFAGRPAVAAFLEDRILDSRFNDALRGYAIRSFADGVYRRDPVRVEAVLRRCAGEYPATRKLVQDTLARKRSGR